MEALLPSSLISNPLRMPATGAPASGNVSDLGSQRGLGPAPQNEDLRLRGWRGGLIRPHRAMIRLHPTLGDAIASAATLIGVTLLWMRFIPACTWLWTRIFRWWVARLDLHAPVVLAPQHWGSHIQFAIPFISLPAGAITPITWMATALFTAVALGISYYLGEEW